MKKVGVVILNYKLKEKTLECVSSVQKSNYRYLDIIVVDNNSMDGLGDAVEKIPRVKFIQTNANLGYAGGNNVGIKEFLKSDADYIFILNPDTTVDFRAISELVVISASEKCGVLGPKIYFDRSKRIFYAGGVFDFDNVLGSHCGVDEDDRGQYNETKDTDFVSGAAMFVSREVFERIGLFDERYFLYYEDADFCIRAREKGFRIMYASNALVHHANAQSTGLGSPLQDYFITRNRMLLAYKFLPLRTRFALFREALRNYKNSTRRLALWDYLTGNFGRGNFNLV